MRDILGNLEPSIDIYPNQSGAVVRNAPDGQRELANLLWGMPTPVERIRARPITAPQHTQSTVRPLATVCRCREPLCGAGDELCRAQPDTGDKDPETGIQRNYWFALNEDRPLFFFAGLWTPWQGVRKVKNGPATSRFMAS